MGQRLKIINFKDISPPRVICAEMCSGALRDLRLTPYALRLTPTPYALRLTPYAYALRLRLRYCERVRLHNRFARSLRQARSA